MKIQDCKIIEFKSFIDERGELIVIENIIPFIIKRVFFIRNQPVNFIRANHAHYKCHQFIVSINGSFLINVKDGLQSNNYILDNIKFGLYIPPMIWVELNNTQIDSICMVFCSHLYSVEDYINNFKYFEKIKKNG